MEKKSGFKSVNAANSGNIVSFSQNQRPVELYDLEIEQTILGIILGDNLKFEQAASYLSDDSFYAPVHGRIWAEIKKKIDNAEKASCVALSVIFKEDEDLMPHGGASAYLSGLVANVILTSDIEDCSRIVRDFYLRRTMLESIENAANSIKTNPSLYQSLEPLEASIQAVSTHTGDVFEDGANSWFRTQKRIEAVRNGEIETVSSGFDSVDDVLLGFQKGCLYIVAGATGMGKTAFALNIAQNIAAKGHVLLFSMEMTQSQLQMRQAASALGITVKKQIQGDLTDDEMRRICEFKVNPNLVVVEGGKDISTLANISKKFVRKFPDAKMIVIDYLQLMSGNPKIPQRVYQIEEITRSLKRLSVTLGIPIVLLSQLSRSISSRDDKRPQLSDLKDSGSIEQDADAVMFVYREEYYLSRRESFEKRSTEKQEEFNKRLAELEEKLQSCKGKASILIDKNRYGEIGSAALNWNGARQKFSDLSKEHTQNDLF